MRNRRVLISGASVAGPTLAFWLSRFGFEVTVVARAPGIRPGGHAVDFRGTGMRVLERMGLTAEVKALQTRTGSISMVNEKSEVVARLPDGFTSGDLEIMRGDLSRLLYEATRDSSEYVFADSIGSLRQTTDAVEVRLQSGRSQTFDLVVGADGLHSSVRALAFGDESKFVRHMGYYIAIFTVPDFLQLHDAGRFVLASELKAAEGDHATAFSHYQSRMRGFVSEAQKMADSVGWFIPRTRLKLWLSKRLWAWMPQATLRELMIEQPAKVASMVALKDHE
jgi:2-polyprenyl-6-methoxyphenol hydroxylase-like FAD-dependent oxidoreductase